MEDFMREYSIWIIVAIIIILMTIIGYIAEKTDFGKKEFSKRAGKKQKKDTKVEQQEERKNKKEVVTSVENQPVSSAEISPETIALEKTPVNNEVAEETINMEKDSTDAEPLFNEPLMDDMKIASQDEAIEFDPVQQETMTYQKESNSVLPEETKEDNFDLSFDAPIVDDGSSKEDNTFHTTTGFNLDEDLNVPFGDDAKVSIHDDMNLDLPDIDSVKQEVNSTKNDDEEDDDIWKF